MNAIPLLVSCIPPHLWVFTFIQTYVHQKYLKISSRMIDILLVMMGKEQTCVKSSGTGIGVTQTMGIHQTFLGQVQSS